MENTNRTITKKKVLSGFSWTYAERMLAQAVSFVVSIILARLLEPEAYGTLALVNVFIGIASALALTGFGSALIQKKEADNVDFSSALFFSFGISLLVYAIIFFCAPLIASFFSTESIIPLIRVFSLSIVIASINTVQHAYVIRNMQFKFFFLSTLFGSIASGIVGIFLAYYGHGVWALVVQYLTNSIINTIVLAFISEWKPKLTFSLSSIKSIYSFGWKVIVSSVVDAIYRQLRSLAIGKKYEKTDLAYYDKGLQFPSLLITNIDTSIANVLMPAISSVQDDSGRVKEMVRRSIKTSSTILFPLLIGLAVCAKPIVIILLTDKWVPSVPYMQLLCIALMMKPMQTANMQGILAIGRSDVYLRIQMIQKLIGIVVIAITVFCFKTVIAIAVGEIVAYLLFAIINVLPNRRLLGYTLKEYIADIMPQMVLAIIMGVIVTAVTVLNLSIWPALILQIFTGAIVYIALAWVLRLDSFTYLLNLLRSYVKTKNSLK
jgi:O-antigen/teichoic acid export membrane protein